MNNYGFEGEQAYFCIVKGKNGSVVGRHKVVADTAETARKRALYWTVRNEFYRTDGGYCPYWNAITSMETISDELGIDKVWAVTELIAKDIGFTIEIHEEDSFNFVIG